MQAKSIKSILSRTILGIGLVASVVSCKKDKNENPGGPDNPNGTKIAMYSEGDDHVKFDYNTDGSVKKLYLKNDQNTGGEELDFTVKYDAQKKVIALENQWETINIEYQNNTMSKAIIKQLGSVTGQVDFQYVNGNLQSSTFFYTGEGDQLVPVLKNELIYNGVGNITRMNVAIATGDDEFTSAGYIDYQYDGKTNPLHEHRQLLALFGYNISKQNITIEDHFDENQQAEDKFQFTYTYNAKGNPEKAKVKQGLPGGEQSEAEVKYAYK